MKHNFVEIKGSRETKDGVTTRRLECYNCWSEVRYNVLFPESEINKRISAGRLKCVNIPRPDEEKTESGIILPSKLKN